MSAGTLYLCATPIGNLDDISARALETLRAVSLIACEDTRASRKLFSRYDVHTPFTSYHHHNRYDKARELVQLLKEGKDIALVTDAGTPAISDPGEELVRLCVSEGVPVTSLPGACALVTALSVSGLHTRRFVFEGFLPPRNQKKERARVIDTLKKETRTILVYEAPHHLVATLKELYEALGDRRVVLCRELTKKFEEVRRANFAEAIAYYEAHEPRGEFVLVIDGKDATYGDTDADGVAKENTASGFADMRSRVATENISTGMAENAETVAAYKWERMVQDMSGEEVLQMLLLQLDVASHVAYYEAKGMAHKDALKQTAKDRGVTRREIYAALHIRDDSKE